MDDAYKISCSMLNSMSRVEVICLRISFTRHVISASAGLNSVSIQGPKGQKVSKPLARVHCPSLCCRSRAVTSFATVYPKIASRTASARSQRDFFLITTASSASCSTRSDCGGSTIGSPLRMSVDGGLRKSKGISGGVWFISRICSA